MESNSDESNVQTSKHKKKELVNRRTFYEKVFKEHVLGDEDKDEQERDLERLIFGGESEILENLSSSEPKKKRHKKAVVDETTAVFLHSSKDDLPSSSVKKPAWEDEEDDHLLVEDKVKSYDKCHRSVSERKKESYKEFAREKFISIYGQPAWADLDKKGRTADSDEESEEELIQKAGNYVLKSTSLPPKFLDVRKCPDLTDQNGIVKSVEFHPSSKVALVAGFSGTTTLYQIDGKNNAKIQSVHFERFPIYKAHFSMSGTELIAGSRDFAHFFIYDMMEGKISKVHCEKGMEQTNFQRFHMSPDGKFLVVQGRFGNIHLLSAKTKEWIGSLKMNGEVLAITFNKSGSTMYSFGTNGEVYVWDMESRLCTHKFNDEGCITGTSLAMSPNDQYLACGSDTGVVNIYESSSLNSSSHPKPVKVIMNLVTEVSELKFNHSSELLVATSYLKPNASKLIHFPSMAVFSNFPNQEKKFGYINSADVSLNSGYLALGNNKGKVFLYRLRHFTNY